MGGEEVCIREDEMEAAAAAAAAANEEVMSEVHLGCPPGFYGPYVSTFTFSIPASKEDMRSHDGMLRTEATSTSGLIRLDDDGDLVISRRRKPTVECEVIIQHRITSSIPNVGFQVWKAGMVLADFVLHMSFTSSDFDEVTVVELGSGTGLVGIILARVARKVFLTDYDIKILDNCAASVCFNSRLIKFNENSVQVRFLDWTRSWPPNTDANDGEPRERFSYSWTSAEIEEAEVASVLLAADVIYNDDLTDSFFSTLKCLMSRGCKKVLYLALEKRYNFSLDDLDVVANGYSHFRSFLRDDDDVSECSSLHDATPCFVGQQIDVAQIPQYMKEYDRGKDVEIWRISYSPSKHP